jgi:hypothetical protein
VAEESTLAPQIPDPLLELSPRPEVRDAVISYDDGISGFRVPRLPSLARADLESPETAQLDDPVRKKPCFDLVEKQIYDAVDALLAHLDQGIDILDDFGLGKLFPGHDVDPAYAFSPLSR